ncbi:polysaccharide deacetylase family protein [Thalassotalea sp. LPB0316]|uniref:polysaccharide deacetylase family protein n=1 Tax=Thalassotalea sp. LPB0316 TaxID=2769490 RepID=UPI0018673169|nr:polysaccharide deacetylase family protein [Thalassotalea sp. LPB0316]QOL26500.1 polysaccharide deacetylase family protein [Thalassotalea sp. LPB0316]
MSLKAKAKKLFFVLADVFGLIEKRWRNLEPGVYIFNYHRIGESQKTLFDRAIFSCDAASFEKQVVDIKNNFTLITTKELAELYEKNQSFDKRYALITFDDGYIDNYTDAFPILKKHQINATFFLTTNFVDSNTIPWWDQVAFILRHAIGKKYQVPGTDKLFKLANHDIDRTIRQIMFYIKQSKAFSTSEMLADIKQRFPSANDLLNQQHPNLFLNWTMAKEMHDNGMTIGSHTLNHFILAQLNEAGQREEIERSKTLIEERLNTTIETIAYPVGRHYCFNDTSVEIVKNCNYKIGFSNEPGINQFTHCRYKLYRYSVATSSVKELRYDIGL